MMKQNTNVKNNVDKSFRDEADLIADAKECGQYQSSDSSEVEDRIDDMEEEDLDWGNKQKNKTVVSKKSATDRTEENDVNNFEEQEDEADDTVFIDNLPKDEFTLRKMIKEVNYCVRDLEKQFFEEEDSEAELELKVNNKKNSISPADHNEQLEKLKSKSHI